MRNRWSMKLTDSDRDRTIAAWMDSTDENVSEVVKVYLYQIATGRASVDSGTQALMDLMEAKCAELRSLILSLPRGGMVAEQPTATEDEAAEIAKRLGSLPD